MVYFKYTSARDTVTRIHGTLSMLLIGWMVNEKEKCEY